jgi:hypothetical protein
MLSVKVVAMGKVNLPSVSSKTMYDVSCDGGGAEPVEGD